MKKLFGITLLMLPVLAASVRAEGRLFNVQAGGSFYIKGGPGAGYPQAGPWYLYWPLEAHFVAPAPTGYPYWPGPQVLPPTSIGGPACLPPGVPPVPGPAAVVPAPAVVTPVPAATAPAPARPTPGPAGQQLSLPPYLQPTSYAPAASAVPAASYYAVPSTGPAPSYWYDR